MGDPPQWLPDAVPLERKLSSVIPEGTSLRTENTFKLRQRLLLQHKVSLLLTPEQEGTWGRCSSPSALPPLHPHSVGHWKRLLALCLPM